MKFKTWKEYLDNRSKTVEKPKEEKVADYDGPEASSPESSEDPNKLVKMSKPAPYNAGKNGKAQSGEKGLPGNTEKMDDPSGDLKEVPQKKSKNEQFLNKTKDLTTKQFLAYMAEECSCNLDTDSAVSLPFITSYAAGKFHPHPPEAIRYVAALAKKNPKILENLIYALKREGVFKEILETIFSGTDGFDAMTDYLGDEDSGEDRCDQLAKSFDNHYNKFMASQNDMYETVAPPFGPEEDEFDIEPEHDNDKKDDENKNQNQEPDQDDLNTDQPTEEPKKLKKKFPEDHLVNSLSKNERVAGKIKKHMGFA